MKLANRAYLVALVLLAFAFAVSAQTTTKSTSTARPEKDARNIAPTVGTGGTPGGPTGLFTIYDAQTLRKGEFTFSIAASNYDRDPGNVDITEIPVSFQIGLTNHIELFFNTDAYRAVKVNNPAALSSFYLPNSQFDNGNGTFTSGGAIVLAPQGTTTTQFSGAAIFRPVGNQPYVQFPFAGSSAGTFGLNSPGAVFGFPTGGALLGASGGSGNTAANFPGIGSIYGSILPGIVLQTRSISATTTIASSTAPTVFSTAPTYLPDAPFVNRTYGESSFGTMTIGGKIRLNSLNSPVGLAVIPFYRFYPDKATDFSGFNQLQRGASPGGSRGDFGVSVAADARVRNWVNVSGNVGYIYNSSVKADLPGGKYTILDRGDEFSAGVGVDFPVNKFFQPILETRYLRYVGGRTPNAFENNPIDALAGVRIFPTRYLGMGFAYRYNANQQDRGSFDSNTAFNSTATVVSPTGTTAPLTFASSTNGVPGGFIPSTDPHGYILQFFAGRRNKREAEKVNLPANVTALTLSQSTVYTPCPEGQKSESGTCPDSQTVNVTTTAVDPENDVLTYNYTVSGGRVTGQGANVTWDLTGVKSGTYTITSGVDDGCGVCGQTKTQTVTVSACPDCKAPPVPCDCPTISVAGPAGVTERGATMTFTANLSGGSQTNQTYNWTVSAGTITAGQNTPSITVTAPSDATNVTATVEVGGLCESCPKNASETAPVAPTPVPRQVDELGAAKDDDVKARVDNFYIELQNDPSAQGYIVNYGTPKEVKARKAQLVKAIKFLKKDASRVTIVDGPDNGGAGINTKFWIVPAGATPPTP